MRTALFAYGFRPLFLAAGVSAAVLVPWWVADVVFGLRPPTDWAPGLWHGHEMLFGFIGAAVGGFLLTAVPSWTGARGFAGMPLMLIASLWLLARVLVAAAAHVPFALVASVDLAYLPALTILVAPPIIRSRNRNLPLLAVLASLWVCNLVFYRSIAHDDPGSARQALIVGIDIMLLLVTIIGGRIVPAFTASALKQAGNPRSMKNWPLVTPLAVASMLGVIFTDLFSPDGAIAGAVALLAGMAQFLRMAQWGGIHTRRLPMIWVLHVGYLWLPIGLLLKGLLLSTGLLVGAFWLHALTAGALATMIVAVMTRASLGHTGRALRAPRLIPTAYGLLVLAAVIRVFGPALAASEYFWTIGLAALSWLAAFGLFLWVYTPILWCPRLDGRPG